MIKDNIRKQLLENPFKHKITKEDIENVQKIEMYIALRVQKTEDVAELQRLALFEEVLYKLKLAYNTEAFLNRQAWLNDVVKRERKITDLERDLKDALATNEECNRQIFTFQMLCFEQNQKIKSLQSFSNH